MCQYSPKHYQACGHTGSRTDLVVTAYCRSSVSGQYCTRVVAGTFPAPGLCPPCQDRMAGATIDSSYFTRELQDDSNPEALMQMYASGGPISPQLMQSVQRQVGQEALRVKRGRRAVGPGRS